MITLTQKLLVAASTLPRDFHTGQLVVAAWKEYPQDFGLDGYDLPDSNKVLAAMMGNRGLVKRGLFDRTQPKWYRLTAKGKIEAEAAKGGKRHALENVCLSEPEADALRSLVTCAAYTRYVGGLHDTINLPQAEVFLSLSPSAIVERARLAVVGDFVRMPDGGAVKASHLDMIEACRVALEKRFARRLAKELTHA